jgi:ribosomal protein L32
MRSKKSKKMTNIVSKCNSCGEFFNSKTELKEHKDRNHRITNSKMAAGSITR